MTLIIGGRDGLGPREKSIIDRTLRKVYAKYLQTQDKNDMPTLNDFYNLLRNKIIKKLKKLHLHLNFTLPDLYRCFSGQTNINVNNRFVVYDTKDLGKQLKTMGLLIVLDQIWNKNHAKQAMSEKNLDLY